MRTQPSAFERAVLRVVSRVPVGRVVTYGDVARLAGRPGAARAVGSVLRRALRPGVPYHRVVAAGGRVGGYGGAPHLKAALLSAEGLLIRRQRIVDFRQRRWLGTRPRPRRPHAPGKG